MKIGSVKEQNGNNFKATLECEHCGHETEVQQCKNSSKFYNRVLPKKKCPICKEAR